MSMCFPLFYPYTQFEICCVACDYNTYGTNKNLPVLTNPGKTLNSLWKIKLKYEKIIINFLTCERYPLNLNADIMFINKLTSRLK